ncbi:MAG TPA: nucleotide exchange factor GrpE [Longimicrobiaceae bacterium]|nr:nucleotide exchange factor GrpE [Longimicrobiaceae bacterium]
MNENARTPNDANVDAEPRADEAEAGMSEAPPASGAAEPTTPEGGESVSRDRYLRLAAEFDNYRKRTERERAETWTRAQQALIERLLEPLDDLQRVAHYDPQTVSAASLHEGIELVERKIMRVLESFGLEAIDAEGQPFDPEVHEALMTTPTEVAEHDGTVADVFQRGYRLKGSLVRPARVRVHNYEG